MNRDRIDDSEATDFDADRPIEHREQDRLKRRSFAEAIAGQIRAVPVEHGFTVAVVGEWGSGKTSVLNMIAETLQEGEASEAVLRFNPWLFGGPADLMTRFFAELSAQLGESSSQQVKEVVKALADVGRAFSALSPYPGTGILMGLVAKVAHKYAERPSLLHERTRLKEALEASNSRIVVLIDDIDRLEPRETREIMRLVRLTSDLPNLVFLLAFDRQRVATSLGDTEEAGQRYLDKIVQVSHAMPAVRGDVLERVFLGWLQEVVDGHEVSELERDVWTGVQYEILKPLLGNLRDAKRYLYSLPITLDAVGQEVALADILGLEALRVLRPRVFELLQANADYLVHPDSLSDAFKRGEDRHQWIREQLTEMLEGAAEERKLLEAVLNLLFPATQGFVGNSSYGSEWDRTWRKKRRVACGEVFRIYLSAAIGEDGVPTSQVRQVLNALSDSEKLAAVFEAMDDQRLEAILGRLADYESDFPIESVRSALPVLVDQMARLSGKFPGPFEPSPRLRAQGVALLLLKRVNDKEALGKV